MKPKQIYILLLLVVFSCTKETIEKQEQPTVPELLYPKESAIDVPTDVTVSWESSKDNNGDNIEYSVYYSNTSDSWTLAGNTRESAYALELVSDTTYYWYVSATDKLSSPADSKSRSFRTEADSKITDIVPHTVVLDEEVIFTVKGQHLAKDLKFELNDLNDLIIVGINSDSTEMKVKGVPGGQIGYKYGRIINSNDKIINEFEINYIKINEPNVKTLSPNSISAHKARINGDVISNGGEFITERGFYWGTSEDNLENTILSDKGMGPYYSTLTELKGGVTYYYRPFAKNSKKTSISDIQSFTTHLIDIEMVLMKGGEFKMGYDFTPYRPEHTVKIDSFYVGKYEITQKEWTKVMGTNPSYFKGEDLPVEQVNWHEVQEFITKLKLQTGINYRLPTEAEWAFASRNKDYLNIENFAWVDTNSRGKTHPVGTKAISSRGVFDMFGNVSEWCSDWYANYESDSLDNPVGPQDGDRKVYRGVSWNNGWERQILNYYFYRGGGEPDEIKNTIGFRLARSK